jgi:hypothetical protein
MMNEEISHFSREVSRLLSLENKHETQINDLKKVIYAIKNLNLRYLGTPKPNRDGR